MRWKGTIIKYTTHFYITFFNTISTLCASEGLSPMSVLKYIKGESAKVGGFTPPPHHFFAFGTHNVCISWWCLLLWHKLVVFVVWWCLLLWFTAESKVLTSLFSKLLGKSVSQEVTPLPLRELMLCIWHFTMCHHTLWILITMKLFPVIRLQSPGNGRDSAMTIKSRSCMHVHHYRQHNNGITSPQLRQRWLKLHTLTIQPYDLVHMYPAIWLGAHVYLKH